jgi:hypothetical protein
LPGRAGRRRGRCRAGRRPRLVVLPGEVGQAGDGWFAAGCGVGSVVIVEVEPGGEGFAAGVFGAVEASQSPAVGQGAVEAFDLAVGLGPVGPGLLRLDAEFGAGVAPGAGFVGWSVVAQHAFDGDAAGGEPSGGIAQDFDGGRGLLVIVDLGVGDA